MGWRMLRGIYTAASGLLANQEQLDITANNIANATTTAFKRDLLVHLAAPNLSISRIEGMDRVPEPGRPMMEAEPVGVLSTGITDSEVFTDFAQGALVETGRNLDLAIQGPGFFVLLTPQGLRYTRAGNFTLSADGTLISPQGFPVLGEQGPILIQGQRVEVGRDGMVVVDGAEVDRLRLVEFANPQGLVKEGGTLYRDEGTAGLRRDGRSVVVSGALEQSNVSTVDELVGLIVNLRQFETGQRAIRAYDETLERAASRVGLVAPAG